MQRNDAAQLNEFDYLSISVLSNKALQVNVMYV